MPTQYEKVSDNILRIVKTTEVLTTDQVTIASLKEQKARLEEQKSEIVAELVDREADIDAQIAEINKIIIEAGKLGIIETKQVEP